MIVLKEALRLLRPFWPMAAFATVIGMLSGLATALLLALVNKALYAEGEVSTSLLTGFAGLCALSVLGTATAGTFNSIIGQRIIAALRKDISGRILRAPIAAIEAIRAHRLIATLTNDVDTISAFTFNFSSYAIALAIIVGGFIYLLALSAKVFVIALASLAAGIAINMVVKRGWIRDYEEVRVAQDELQKQYRAISDGAKELKLSRGRRTRVHGILLSGAADRIADLKSRAMRLFWMAEAAGSALFFTVIGVLLAGQGTLGIDAHAISGAVIVLLYIRSPVEQIAGALPVLDQARVSFKRIAALSKELDQHEPGLALGLDASVLPEEKRIGRIEMRGVIYRFPGSGTFDPFILGPVNLTIQSGDLLFIVGENGSGKTTLIKLLLGLYEPHEGEILLDGLPVTADNRDDYRQLFTTVFSDFYLFEDLIFAGAQPVDATPYLERLELAHKVHIQNGRFSTTDLSTGQKKRLAFVQAYLDQRPVVVTDEWAADQDPAFRQTFYAELLPDLKRQGKTLIVISHDDRYFDVADRIIRLHAGKIIPDAVAE